MSLVIKPSDKAVQTALAFRKAVMNSFEGNNVTEIEILSLDTWRLLLKDAREILDNHMDVTVIPVYAEEDNNKIVDMNFIQGEAKSPKPRHAGSTPEEVEKALAKQEGLIPRKIRAVLKL